MPGPKLYCSTPRVDPGGGGVNVARAIHKLGGGVNALVAVGGASGQRLMQLLAQEGVPVHPVPVSGETRQSLAVTDEETGGQYRFSLPGHTLTDEDGARLISEIAATVQKGCHIVLSGGVAPGLGDDFPERIHAAITTRTDKLIVDTSKAPLLRLVQKPARPLHILRLDKREAVIAAGHPLASLEDCVAFAQRLIDRGVARTIVTSREAEGSILVTEGARYSCRGPEVEVVSKVGAGDAFVGALTLALTDGQSPAVALQWAVAAATATMGTEGTTFCARPVVQSFLPACEVVAF